MRIFPNKNNIMEQMIAILLFLVHQSSLMAMEKHVILLEHDNTATIEEYIKSMPLLASIDSAIKENISFQDPQAFEKIARYAQQLLLQLQKKEQFLPFFKINSDENFSDDDEIGVLEAIQKDVGIKNLHNEAFVEIWNITKTNCLLILNAAETVERELQKKRTKPRRKRT